MCTIIQALNVAQAIAVTRTLPEGINVRIDGAGVVLQGDFADPDALARGLDLTRDTERDFTSEPKRPHYEAMDFRSWHGTIQNILVELVDVKPAATGVAS